MSYIYRGLNTSTMLLNIYAIANMSNADIIALRPHRTDQPVLFDCADIFVQIVSNLDNNLSCFFTQHSFCYGKTAKNTGQYLTFILS